MKDTPNREPQGAEQTTPPAENTTAVTAEAPSPARASIYTYLDAGLPIAAKFGCASVYAAILHAINQRRGCKERWQPATPYAISYADIAKCADIKGRKYIRPKLELLQTAGLITIPPKENEVKSGRKMRICLLEIPRKRVSLSNTLENKTCVVEQHVTNKTCVVEQHPKLIESIKESISREAQKTSFCPAAAVSLYDRFLQTWCERCTLSAGKLAAPSEKEFASLIKLAQGKMQIASDADAARYLLELCETIENGGYYNGKQSLYLTLRKFIRKERNKPNI